MADATTCDGRWKPLRQTHRRRDTHTLRTGSNPVLTTEGVNPETLEKKVDDCWKDSNIVRWWNGRHTLAKAHMLINDRFDSCSDY